MPLTLNNTSTVTADNIIVGGTNLTDLYVTQDDLNTATGGLVTQQDVDDSIAPLISKDVSYNNTITTHISLIDTNTTDIATNAADITMLDTKNLTNFHNISSLTHLLNTNYQTTTQLNSNFVSPTTLTNNHYTKTEIDTTLGSYFTSTQIDSGFSTQSYINSNIYTKTEVDGLVGAGGGYADIEIDSFLSLKEDKATFTDKISFTPIVDISAPAVIQNGFTLKNSTVNDKVISVFKNATNYITLQGNKIIANATSDDSIVNLDLNPSGNITIANTLYTGVINNTNTLTTGSIDITNNLNVGGECQITDANTTLEKYTNATKSNVSLDIRTTEEAIRIMNGAKTDADTNTFIECNNATGGTTLFKQTYFKDTVNYENENINISNSSGLTLYKDTTDASSVLTVKNAQGYIRFNSFNINAYNTSNDSSSLLLLNTANGNGVYCLSLGFGAIQGANKLNVSGGNANFGGTSSFQNISTFNSDIYVKTSGRIFQRADANNSLTVISTEEINFSLQSNRTTDPTTGTIALQLNDTNGITINRAVVKNQTFNSIGKITAEADLDVWGGIYFQHSSAIKETLNGSDYDLDIRNGDTDRAINFIIGTIGSTPELQLTEGKVNILGNLEITHDDITGQQRVLINNPDDNGWIRLSNNNLSTLDATTTGVDVYGDLSYTGSLIPSSDKKLKKDIKEVNSKKAVELLKYIKPKTYHFIDDRQQGKSCIGFIANDFMETKKMPDEWQNVVKEGKDGYLKFDYATTTPILWSALQATINEVEKLKKEVNKLKGKGKGESD